MKVSVAVTARKGIVVEIRSMPGNPYDWHTVDSALEHVQILAETTPAIVLADYGYKDVMPACGAKLLLSHTGKLPAKLNVCYVGAKWSGR